MLGKPDQPELEQLAEKALERLEYEHDQQFCVALEGSLAEGFGNGTSDIDFLIIEAGDHECPKMPTLLFIDGRRVEVRRRSLVQVRRMQAELEESARSAEAAIGLEDDFVDRCHRLTNGLWLRGDRSFHETVTSGIRPESLRTVVTTIFRNRALDRAGRLRAAIALGAPGQARRSWYVSCLVAVAKFWVATRGETYVSEKWIGEQLARQADHEPAEALADALQRAVGDDELFDTRILATLAAQSGLAELEEQLTGQVDLRRRPSVTTWPLNDVDHVVADRERIYRLNLSGSEIWRTMRFGVELDATLDVVEPSTRQFIWSLFEHRLIDVTVAGKAVSPHSSTRPTTASAGVWVSMAGSPWPDPPAEPAVKELSVTAEQFTTWGLDLMWANIMIENALEDATGAVDEGQWLLVQTSARAMVRHLARALCASHGMVLLPPNDAAVAALRKLSGIDSDLSVRVEAVEYAAAPTDSTSAADLLERAQVCVDLGRRQIGLANFPSSFDSAAGWEATIGSGYDWVRLGAFVDAEFPVDEARDVLATQAGPS